MVWMTKLHTLTALGLGNVARVAFYRIGLQSGLHRSMSLRPEAVQGPFFERGAMPQRSGAHSRSADLRFFGGPWPIPDSAGPPDWHLNPQSMNAHPGRSANWWDIPDFDPAVGDIKTVWEASRMDWLLGFAQRAALGSVEDFDQINVWLADWVTNNPAYLGANWKCGQEASIRVLHLATAAMVMGQHDRLGAGLRALIRNHLPRIAPTIGYAIGQMNNHGTSEAAALFVGGTWLGDEAGRKWAAKGRRWLENRALALIEPDGTFSQYSVTYHRLMLDTFAIAEMWRNKNGLAPFSSGLMSRLRAATHWLRQMVDPATGDAPNLGANDGAQLFALSDCAYRDFRPTVQLASVLFASQIAFPAGPWDQQLVWLDVVRPQESAPALASTTFADGGLHVLRVPATTAYLRYPRFHFRPSQADALHLDLWVGGENVLRDAGSYSYNVTPEEIAYFNGVAAHNTIQFDGRDQMPRLGRFLFGDWLKTLASVPVHEGGGHVTAAASYRDNWSAIHDRRVVLADRSVQVTDRISGFARSATLRWRLRPGEWHLEGSTVTCGTITLAVSADVRICKITLTRGFESRYYLRKNSLPVLEVTVEKPGTLVTDISF